MTNTPKLKPHDQDRIPNVDPKMLKSNSDDIFCENAPKSSSLFEAENVIETPSVDKPMTTTWKPYVRIVQSSSVAGSSQICLISSKQFMTPS